MAILHELQVRLSEEELQYVREKVASGDFPSESEVVSQGVALLRRKDREFEVWLSKDEIAYDPSGKIINDPIQARWQQEVLLPMLDDLKANPNSVLTAEELKASLAKARNERSIRA